MIFSPPPAVFELVLEWVSVYRLGVDLFHQSKMLPISLNGLVLWWFLVKLTKIKSHTAISQT